MQAKKGRSTAAAATETDRVIGARLREARLARQWSQAELCSRLVPVISFQQYQKYENGKNRLSASRLWEISRLLETPVDRLLPAAEPATAPPPRLSASESALIDAYRRLPEPCRKAVRVLIDALAGQA